MRASVLIAVAASVAMAAEYSYNPSASNGPSTWGTLTNGDGSARYPACSSTGQSPISVAYREDFGRDGAGLGPIDITESPSQLITVANNGVVLTIGGFDAAATQRTTMRDPTGESEGAEYALSHIDVHVPSEHGFARGRFDGELQLHFTNRLPVGHTFADTTPGGIIVDVLLSTSSFGENEELAKLFALGALPTQATPGAVVPNVTRLSQNPTLASAFRASRLLPGRRDYVTYDGSLTRPPCTRNMRHVLLLEPVPVSAAQLRHLARHVFVTVPTVGRLPTVADAIGNTGNARPFQQTTTAPRTRLYRELPNPHAFRVAATGAGTSSQALTFSIVALVIAAVGIGALALAGRGVASMMDRLSDAVTEVPGAGRRDGSAAAGGGAAAADVSTSHMPPGVTSDAGVNASQAQAVAALAAVSKDLQKSITAPPAL